MDMVRDVEEALEQVIETGADRVLTSGGEPTALQGRSRLKQLVLASEGRIGLIVGGGVRPENVREICQATRAVEYHAALRHTVPSPVKHTLREVHLGDPGVDDYARTVVRAEDVRSLQAALRAASAEASAPAAGTSFAEQR